MKYLQFHRLAAISALALVAQPLLPTGALAESTAATQQHPRLLPLAGSRNFRDLGGYRTADGHSVKWGKLFRSGTMYQLTAQDYVYLNRVGIQTVVDFRSTEERQAEPTKWQGDHAPTMLADDYAAKDMGLMPNADMKNWTVDQAQEVMAASYPKIMATFSSQYRRMFQQLLAGDAPLVFHCSAGKDRTGVAAALILTALGVPRATIEQDYLLTNQYLDASAMMAKSANSPAAQPWMSLPAPVLQAFGKADRLYIDAVLDRIDAHPDGARGYLRDEMGLSEADIAKLRQLYLTKA
ncbi:tyrosine-protein phosphatase [Sphingobium sp.]|uniref:tyrosine-protein phosphatase n=1 Tax=Sphingobium sp. TaxID=1912891 RepID=UPI002B75BFF0|nr:tyrosine-protein phosphatase [Sphingobium sp.]HUD90401.1 tyrosine-protein phosphatase [Sphingobium sp.]